MVTNNTYKRLKPTLVAAVFLFLAACQGTSQDIGARIAKNGNGGTGKVAGRATETPELTNAKIDPRGLPAYTGALASKLTKIGADSDSTWDRYFDLKNWYMATSTVAEKLPGPMTTTDDDNGNFIVQQTQYEVFIDKDLYEKIQVEKRPALLLREYLKGLYLLKYLSDADLCKLMKEVYKEKVKECIGVAATTPTPDKNASEDTEKTLSEEVDASGVDSIVSTQSSESKETKAKERPKLTANSMSEADSKIVEQGAKYIETLDLTKATETIVRELGDKGFDTRVFKYKLGKTAAVEAAPEATGKKSYKEITLEEYKAVLAQLGAIKDLNCSDISDPNHILKCPLTFAEAQDGKGVKFDLNIKVSEKFSIAEGILLNSSLAKIGVGSFTDPQTKGSFVVIPMTSAGIAAEKQVQGTVFRSQYILAIKRSEKAALEFFGLLSVPGIIKSAVVDEKTHKQTCTAELNGAKTSDDGSVTMGPDNVALFASIYPNSLDASILSSISPTAPCY